MTTETTETTDTVAVTPTARTRPVYTRVQATGLVVAAMAPFTILVLAIGAGMDIAADLPFFAAMVVVPLVAAVLVSRFGTWAKIVGIVVTLLAAAAMFWAAFGLAYPTSFADFTVGTLHLVGLVLGLGGGIAGLVQKRRGRLAAEATPGERRIIQIALAIVAVAALVSGIANLALRSSPVGGTDAAVEMHDFEFAPATLEVAAGQAVQIEVTNRDPVVHSFTVPDLGVDVTLVGGASTIVDLNAPAGTYTLYCKPHSNLDEPDPEDAGMAGRIIAN